MSNNDLTPEALNCTDLSMQEWHEKREKLEQQLYEVSVALLSLVDADTIELEGKDPYFTLKLTTLPKEEQDGIKADTAAGRTIN